MKASGSATRRHSARFLIPMPGSTMTGITPTFSIAKVKEKKSRLGFTMRTVRTPGPIPTPTSAWAIRSERRCSSSAVSSA